jgi:hypothetical protein
MSGSQPIKELDSRDGFISVGLRVIWSWYSCILIKLVRKSELSLTYIDSLDQSVA